MPRWSKITLRILGGLLTVILIAYIGVAYYVNTHKKALLESVTRELNKNMTGSLTIGNMEPTFLQGFPGVSLSLNNVVIRDKQWAQHKHTLLEAKDFNISVNTLGLLRGTITINKINITNASIYLYTDSTGYSNTSLFKKKQKDTTNNSESNSPAEIRKFNLNDVTFIMDNQKGHKLFSFTVDRLQGDIDYSGDDWRARVALKGFAKSLAFNTRRGSFIKDKSLDGNFDATYADKTGIVKLVPKTLKIGDDPFVIGAEFNIGVDPTVFAIHINVKQILWRSASALLAPNIKSRLDQFNLDKPIDVKCDLIGNMGAGGDPNINVTAQIKNNALHVPGAKISDCNFTGVYTNNYVNGRGFSDANSAVKLYQFKGTYEEIPFAIDTAAISNFDKPVATGVFRAAFPITKLNNVLGADLLTFSKGTADVKLAYTADLVNFRLNKPIVTGYVNIKNASANYVPRNLKFTNTAISLNFTGPDLFISNIRLQSGKSIVFMEGNVRNFLNLYYNAPEKIVLSWQIKSPQLYLGEFLGFLGTRKSTAPKKRSSHSTLSSDLNEVFDKSKVDLHLRVDKIYYNKFLATNAVAELLLSEDGIAIKDISVKHAGGALKVNGNLFQEGSSTRFLLNSSVTNANIKSFFYGFDNFGLKSLTSDNLRGNLYAAVKLSGRISNAGAVLPGSLRGSVAFDLKNGALLNFDPIANVGKFAFPLRDMKNITFSNLKGTFDIQGEQIQIRPMKISSSVLNMDVAGVYALGKGTNIALDVPLRNPKKDAELQTAAEKEDKRMRGIVLHLLATDGDDGKIKIKLNKNRDKS
ncbi:AsmA family protein [Pedobacter duraquae]|uniref:AsmA-like protein n=1 Tax=Pedobacter duraquae TaxID=425511 RepID=A0A4R6IHL0_9SPHI|nr:AsmA family protein [Pedobacter duraquae]TDO20645.1 AsmA-like protein [Pedobacter duraquae]